MSAIEPVRRRDPRIPVSPQLALRVTIIGGVAMVMFGVIFFRLWYLQVLSSEQYVVQANANRARQLPIPAPRGEILDREGRTLVGSTVTNSVQIAPAELPESISAQVVVYQEKLDVAEAARRKAVARLSRYEAALGGVRHLSRAQRIERRRLRDATGPPRVPVPALPRSAVKLHSLFDRLGGLIHASPRAIDERVVEGMATTPYAQVTIKTDAGPGPLTVLGERASEFPGVVQEPVAIREYPYGEMAGQIFGYVGQVSKPELGLPAFRGVTQGTIVGQSGLEYSYDRYLRGVPGIKRIAVNAEGQPVPSSKLASTPPRAGYTLQTTIDLPLQRAGEQALLEGMEHARAGSKPAIAGAFVAINPLNGEIYAIGSSPSFDPDKFAKPLSQSEYEALAGRNGEEPGRLTDLADEGEYPTGSTFKPITAMAALEAGVITPEEGLGAGQCIVVGAEQFCNAGHADYGAADLVDALKVSSDTYFFTVGELAQEHGGEIIQKKAHELGVGEPTGIDLPGEFPGVVPNARWLEEQNELEFKCQREHHGQPCYIVGEPGAPWTVGYNMDLAVGQGELLTDPLQMAVAYSTLANAYRNGGNGTVVTPHLGKQIDEANRSLLQTLRFRSRPVHLNYEDLSLVMEGIHDAASESGGTSADVWAGWNQEEDPVYGKTGTAERTGHVEQSWYMCYIGNAQRPLVIAVTVEEGGFGAETAAPIARLIASQWYGKEKKFVAGTSKTF
ncbi:MAG TPA: penicillin-binding transpeptidase domain-containing protein [Solirubrobacteraceae bacterium]|nr:penicillin-binding transpeptidase domain-containing protein [Solirubrobacteraceae bacterium]